MVIPVRASVIAVVPSCGAGDPNRFGRFSTPLSTGPTDPAAGTVRHLAGLSALDYVSERCALASNAVDHPECRQSPWNSAS